MSAADLSSSSTPEAAGDVQADSPAAEAGVGEGEGGAGEGQQGSHEEEVVEGGSGAGVPVIKPAPVYNNCLLYTSPSPRDKRQSRMPSSA